MNNNVIFLDNASTSKMSEKSAEIFNNYACNNYFNPSAIYSYGAKVHDDIKNAKINIAKHLGTQFNQNLIFCGSATECNNLAIMGCYRKNFGKMIFSVGEHPAVYNTAMHLKSIGANVDFVNLQTNGEIDYDDLKNKLTPDTSFISIMHVSNETGMINDLKKISDIKNHICPKAIFHSDGVQAFGKTKVNVEYFGVDLYTISAHKINGPKGVGALYVKDIKLLNPIIFGGGQEYNLRSGTENVAGIMAFSNAVDEIGDIRANQQHINMLKNEFLNSLSVKEVKINSYGLPHILSLSFDGVNGETLVHMMEQHNILISRGSACSSKKSGNRILENMGLSPSQILGSVRISFSKYNTLSEAKVAGKTLSECYKQLLKTLYNK